MVSYYARSRGVRASCQIYERIWGKYFKILSKKCLLRESNTGPSDLQSDALPTELSRRFNVSHDYSSTLKFIFFVNFQWFFTNDTI